MLTVIDLSDTVMWKARVFRRFLFHAASWSVYGVLILVACAISDRTGSWTAIGWIPILGFGLLVIHLFIKKLETASLPSSAPDEALLSASVMEHLPCKRGVLAADLLAAAVIPARGQFILELLGTTADAVLAAFDLEDAGRDCRSFLAHARTFMTELREQRIDSTTLLRAFFNDCPSLRGVLNTCDVALDDMENVLWCESINEQARKAERGWTPAALLRLPGSMGRSWVAGYAWKINHFTKDISESILWSQTASSMIHRQTVDELSDALLLSQNKNFLLLGRDGVGKRTLIRNIAYALRTAEMARNLPYSRVMLVRSDELLSGTEQPAPFFLKALREAQKAGRFILVFENLPLLLRAATMQLHDVLHTLLQARNLNVIAIADPSDYHITVKLEPAIDSLLEKVPVDDATPKEVMTVLLSMVFRLRAHGVHVTYQAMKSLHDLCRRHLGSHGSPGREVGILTDAVFIAKRQGCPLLRDEHIREALSKKVHMNVGRLSPEERGKLLHLTEALHRTIVGQEDALQSIVNTLKRSRVELHETKRPFGTFLFLGPTGVGKTETAKVLAQEYFGSGASFIRIDMNEYGTENSVIELIGSSEQGGNFREGFLMKRVQDRPFSLILLDELEKAHPRVVNALLQILDEGEFTDVRGIRYDFRSTIIIATSNAGNFFMRDVLQQKQTLDRETFKKNLLDIILREKIFSPEFLNRFDDVILFLPLSGLQVQTLTRLALDALSGDLLQRKGITVTFDEDIIPAIAERGYGGEFGARELRRLIQDTVENYLANLFLEHPAKRGDRIIVHLQDLHIG